MKKAKALPVIYLFLLVCLIWVLSGCQKRGMEPVTEETQTDSTIHIVKNPGLRSLPLYRRGK